jgi:hypothetical protein
MEQPCYKCGQLAEPGRPFCPHCSAPQIRVVIPEPAVSAPVETIPPADSSDHLSLHRVLPVLPMQWSQAAKPCAIAALIAAVGMVLKLIVPLIAAVGAGFLAVALYRRQNLETAMTARIGARIGAVCGFFCFAITSILAAVRIALLGEGGVIRHALLDAVEQQASRYSDPQFQASLDFMRSSGGLVFMMAVLAIFGLALFIVLGMIGGAIGGASFGRRNR